MNYIIKRDGRKVPFNKRKIENAIFKAFEEVDGEISSFAEEKADKISAYIENEVNNSDTDMDIESIQDLVENGLMASKRKDVARAYITYRHDRSVARGNSTDKTIDEIASGTSDYWSYENSNKDFKVVTTQRDYFAGAVSEDYTKRKLLTKEIVKAHEEGIIHFHDMDYFAQNVLSNCSLINLEDMLQNGTVINKVKIDKPHKFLTACTIATQIILGVSSSQYGGCTITLTHLAPFVRDSFISYLKDAIEWIEDGDETLDKIINGTVWLGYDFIENNYPKIYKYAISKTKKEINAGVQTFNYQVNSMTNTNGWLKLGCCKTA